METILCIGVSMVTSTVVTKILAAKYFEIADSYVKDVLKKIEDFMEYVKNKR